MKHLLILLWILNALVAQAGAVMTLRGELYSMSSDDCIIRVANSLYRVDRRALTPPQRRRLEAAGASGKLIELEVPMDAIKQVRPLNPQKVSR